MPVERSQNLRLPVRPRPGGYSSSGSHLGGVATGPQGQREGIFPCFLPDARAVGPRSAPPINANMEMRR